MVQRSKLHDLQSAWRALSDSSSPEERVGWRTIAVGHPGERLLAGRKFPENQEALLVGFDAREFPVGTRFPEASGFEVKPVRGIAPNRESERWVALCRRASGNIDLFSMMADDVLQALIDIPAGEKRRLSDFLSRVVAWQQFMQRIGSGILSPEAELGLVGELETIEACVVAGLNAHDAVEAWKGPVNGLHDLVMNTGAIEVKSTLARTGFPARIGSLAQLDDTLVRPLFVVANRYAIGPTGRTLPELVAATIKAIGGDAESSLFMQRLGQAGFVPAVAELYTTRFRSLEIRVLRVDATFPRLKRGSIPAEILEANYVLDLAAVRGQSLTLIDALTELGVR